MTAKELDALKGVDVRIVDRAELVDIREVPVERGLPAEERIKRFIGKVKNPYCFRVGGRGGADRVLRKRREFRGEV